MLLLGDLQYESGLRDDYAVSFGRSFGVLRTQSVPVPGNHEYGEGSANGYFSYSVTPRIPSPMATTP